jgi:alginate O-acetyltransferase complex protein AlgI
VSFNSIDFAVFLTIVFILYWTIARNSLIRQNIVLLVASYFFYGWWDWRLLFLIVFISTFNYFSGIGISKQKKEHQRKFLLILSLFINLGILGFFKYYNFFIENLSGIFSIFGNPLNISTLNILLPIGISFYTFQNISYIIDVYREEILPEKNILIFFNLVAFFPKLVTGPIEKSSNILPQLNKKRVFDYNLSVDGLRQILWGIFKKIVIADNCAFFVNEIFNNTSYYPGSTLLLGVFLFSFQIYADFSGYSDIAIGSAKLLGINLMQNFNYPYFAESVADFWRRWHISFSNWLRDYIFIPLQFKYRDLGVWGNILSIMITFILCGLWHGANWTFIVWGFLHGTYMSFSLLTQKRRRLFINNIINRNFINSFLKILTTFILVSFAWIFFKVENLSQAWLVIKRIFSASLFSVPQVTPMSDLAITIFFIFVLVGIEWFQRDNEYALQFIGNNKSRIVRWGTYYFILLLIFSFGGNPGQFIYIQF